MWFALGGAVVVIALGWLGIAAVAQRLTVDLALVHEHPLTVLRDEGDCWSCGRVKATTTEGLCARCSGGLLREASAS